MSELLVVFPAVRVDIFEDNVRAVRIIESKPEEELIFTGGVQKDNIEATAILVDGEFIVKRGSRCRKDWVGNREKETSYRKLYRELEERNIISLSADDLIEFFKRTMPFPQQVLQVRSLRAGPPPDPYSGSWVTGKPIKNGKTKHWMPAPSRNMRLLDPDLNKNWQ